MLEYRDATNFVDHCLNLSDSQPNDLAFTWLRDGEHEAGSLTFGQLDTKARQIAVCLEERGLRGERALLLYSPGLEFISAFIGCLYAGVVAVPMNTPRNTRAARSLFGIASHAEAKILLTDACGIAAEWSQLDVFGAHEALATDSISAVSSQDWRHQEVDPEQLAFLQYTSGSTGSPKGVQISHRNMQRNEQMIRAGFGTDSNTIWVTWLPAFHDMGLIGNVLQPLFIGAHSILMAPGAFVQKPIRWLQAISRYRATDTGGPNFGYELCTQRISTEQLEGLDLSCLEVAYNGSEPIRAQTLENFTRKFSSVGFRREAFYPCYGMAEASLYVSGGLRASPFVSIGFDTEALMENRVLPTTEVNQTRLVGCGRTWLDQRILIVDPDSFVPIEGGLVGEIWLQGTNVSAGYLNLPIDEEDPFQAFTHAGEGPFFRTGDLGFQEGQELFVTGRIKDILIQHGRNFYPQDIECLAAESHPALRPDSSAAFTVDDGENEHVVIVQEVHRDFSRPLLEIGEQSRSLRKELTGAIRAIIAATYGIQVRRVVLVRHASIPKTSSGKIRRRKCRTMLAEGQLSELHPKASESPPSAPPTA
ncbi:MAG: acyl-CoA synthetase (AMP-forming)/AMP-acid ligase II [Planctomycetota bacterium]|jgi:acyl-CoA synthetase (AMP-forming)/AMP-acid ligase II